MSDPSGNPIAPVPNHALRGVLTEIGMTREQLAAGAGIDPRTIDRWCDGERAPHHANARRALDVINEHRSESLELWHLWPDRFPKATINDPGTVEVSVYPNRVAIPNTVWTNLFGDSEQAIDILVYGGTFLFDGVPKFVKLIRAAAGRGVQIRFLVGDPDSEEVTRRGREEGIGASLAGRCRMTVDRLRPLNEFDNLTVKLHATPLYTSIFRGDDVLIANPHLYGAPASDNPAMVIRREDAPELWDDHTDAFERVWQKSIELQRV